MTKEPSLAIVVPVFNEEENIEPFFRSLQQTLGTRLVRFQLMFVDDGSSDATWQKITGLTANNSNVLGVKLSRNFGKESAICAGLEHTEGDAVIVIDVDLQHPPELIPRMVALWREQNFQIVEAKKVARGQEPVLIKLLAPLFYKSLSAATRQQMEGSTDFKLLDRAVVEAWKKMPEKITFFRGMSRWVGYRSTQLEFSVAERTSGSSKWGGLKLIRLAIDAITSFSSLPLQIVSLAGVLFVLFALLLGMQTMFVYLSGGSVDGFTTVILLLLIVGSVLSLGMGVIGLYLSRIYEEVKSRPRYVIDEIQTPQVLKLKR